MNKKLNLILLKALVHIAAFLPIAYAYYAAITDQAGGDPVEYILHFTGIGALNILLITLAITPLAKKFKKPQLVQMRRMVGLWVFFYATCHVLSFLAFETQFDVALFFSEVIERPYIVVGAISWLLLLALSITSVNALKRRMKKRWQTLHNAIYIIVILGVWHFYWSVKSDVSEPLLYLLGALILLYFRKKKIKQIFQ